MPACTLHLIRLQPVSDRNPSPYPNRAQFLQRLLSASCSLSNRVISGYVVRRPVIVANRIDPVYLNSTRWDLVLVMGPEKGSPQSSRASEANPATPLSLQDHPQTKADISAEYVLDIGVPSRILDAHSERTKTLNAEAVKSEKQSTSSLLKNPSRTHPGYKPKTSQLLEMSDDLVELIDELDRLGQDDKLVDAKGPVQQLNLLCFQKSEEDKKRYYEYGKNFAKVAAAYGGEPKILGSVLDNKQREQQKRWDEVSLVHYHSLRHFAAMAGSEEYQKINRDYRLPSLDDTTIICTQQVDLDGIRAQGRARI